MNQPVTEGVSPESLMMLTDMGLKEEEALQALQFTNGNVEQAIEYLFRNASGGDLKDDTEVQISGESQHIENRDMNLIGSQASRDRPPSPQVNYSSLPPQVPPRNTGVSPFETYDSQTLPYTYPSGNSSSAIVPANGLPRYNLYEDVSAFEREESSPPILIPFKVTNIETYLCPLIVILHEITGIRNSTYAHAFSTLGFDPRWYKGEDIKLPEDVTTVSQDDRKYDLRYLLELQRLFGFLDGKSRRAFASIDLLLKYIPADFVCKSENIDGLSDEYEAFYGSIVEQLQIINVEDPLKFFESTIELADDDIRPFGILRVENSEFDVSLFKTLEHVIWGEDFENGALSYIADILPISLEGGSNEYHNPIPIEIPEIFHPQVFSSEYRTIAKTLCAKVVEIDKERREISSETMKNKIHAGKSISSFLETSLKFLSSEIKDGKNEDDSSLKAAHEDLEKIKANLYQRARELNDEQEKLGETRSKLAYDENFLLEKSERALEPYLLVGVIIQSLEYYFVKKSESLIPLDEFSWFHVTDTIGAEGLKVIEKTKFDDVKRAVYARSSTIYPNQKSSIVLIYVRKSVWELQDDVLIPEAVLKFIEKDQLELEKSLELLDSSSDEDSVEETDEESGVDESEGQNDTITDSKFRQHENTSIVDIEMVSSDESHSGN